VRALIVVMLICAFGKIKAQTIVDPCFLSLPVGQYHGGEDLQNVCDCDSNDLATDLIEWDGTAWIGQYPNSYVDLPPPEGCNVRAIWMGADNWTHMGEGFAMRVDKPFEAGKKYTFTFTYASNGHWGDNNFSPIVYTDHKFPTFRSAYEIGRLPPVSGWATNSITFIATEKQSQHDWIMLRAFESSGIVLANCEVSNPLETNFLQNDTTLCMGDQLLLTAASGKNYSYLWNNGTTGQTLTVTEAGEYSVEISYYKCTSRDSVNVSVEDCNFRLVMPNVFTPDGNDVNPLFVPMEHYFIDTGSMAVFNRWGKLIFTGDLFSGWNGKDKCTEAAAGVYFYEVLLNDKKNRQFKRKGTITILR
jgi:gliding motility-associated-like protein